jgi:serine/threonine protein kinase
VIDAELEPIPGYRLAGRLGAGAFGEVWTAVGPDGKPVALKFFDTRQRVSSVIQAEVRMLRALGALRHPHIIEFHGVHVRSHYVIIQMERADGNLADLRQAYREETGDNIPIDHGLELLAQAAEALDFVATQKPPGFDWSSSGLQHCDVKPANLLMVGDVLKVADFGLCAAASRRTHRSGWRGTPPYAAPELFNGAASSRTDQYALAVTYCQLCLGERVFRPVCPGRPDMPINLDVVRRVEATVLARALAPNWLARWPSCREFVTALSDAVRRPRSSCRIRRVPPSAARGGAPPAARAGAGPRRPAPPPIQ